MSFAVGLLLGMAVSASNSHTADVIAGVSLVEPSRPVNSLGIAVGQRIEIAGRRYAGHRFAVLNILHNGFQYGERDENGRVTGSAYMSFADAAKRVVSNG